MQHKNYLIEICTKDLLLVKDTEAKRNGYIIDNFPTDENTFLFYMQGYYAAYLYNEIPHYTILHFNKLFNL